VVWEADEFIYSTAQRLMRVVELIMRVRVVELIILPFLELYDIIF